MKPVAMLYLMAVAAASCAAAARTPKLGQAPVAFFGSGLLIPYYGGVVEVLLKAGVITPDTLLAGNSGGAWAAVAIAMGMSQADLVKMFMLYSAGVDPEGVLMRILPDNITELVNGRVRMGVAQLDASQTTFNGSAAWVVDKWDSKEDVVSAMLATACLPCFLGNTTYCTFRGQPVLDGGYAVSFEQLCPGGDVDGCIKMSAVTTAALETGALPGNCSDDDYSSREDITTQLYENGQNAAAWPIAEVEARCPESAYADQAPFPEPTEVQAWWPVLPDIWPGKYGPLPDLNGTQITACQWNSWTRALPRGLEAEAVLAVAGQGVKDATAWLEERAAAGL